MPLFSPAIPIHRLLWLCVKEGSGGFPGELGILIGSYGLSGAPLLGTVELNVSLAVSGLGMWALETRIRKGGSISDQLSIYHKPGTFRSSA